ncbi:MAG: class I SAM-dependent methyltransferase [Agathobacter sp.]|nr:class I SAM-dependent methyltransferase [Agathobacter sp.]
MLHQVENERINQIRISERNSHIEIYSKEELYKSDSWLNKPIRTVVDIIPCFKDYETLNVLDLGSGIGRNSIAVAQFYKKIKCNIDCVDLLELAIEKLNENAVTHDVDMLIHGIVESIEEYYIEKEKYDFIMAISALEHINSTEAFKRKLIEIRNGIRRNGIVCLVINSNVQEWDKKTKQELDAQFEVNFPTDELKELLQDMFRDWEVIKFTTQEQQYDIPRENGLCELKTKVVTLVARR